PWRAPPRRKANNPICSSGRRGPASSNIDAACDVASPGEGEASRVLPSESRREGREKVAAQTPIEQDDKDRAREDDLRDRKIRVDVDDRGKLDSERDGVGRVRGQRLAGVVDQPDHDGVLSVNQVGKGDGPE